MTEFLAAAAVALFAILYKWSDLIDAVVGKRLGRIVAVASLASMWAAFHLDPSSAIEVVMQPAERIAEQVSHSLSDSLDDANSTQPPVNDSSEVGRP